MKPFVVALTATLLLIFSVSVWSASTKEEIVELKAQVAEMREDLAEIKKLLEEGARAPSAAAEADGFRPQTVSIGTSPVMGDPNAPITLIEYSDYQCPFCARHYTDVMPTIVQEYIETGKVRFVMRENPLESIHPQAMNASMAALCAKDQGKYWEMHNALFENQKDIGVEAIRNFASTIGLDGAAFHDCMVNKKHQQSIRADMASATKLGVQGTPGFVLGLTDPKDKDKVNLSLYIRGAQGVEQFRASIDSLLAEAE